MTNKRILTLITLLLFLFLLAGCDWPWTINKPPEITSTAITTATVGVEYIYDVDATDPDAEDVLTYSLIDEPGGMLIDEDNGVITWTPAIDDVGDVDVTVEVSDGKLNDTQDFTITVSAVVVELDHIVVLPETMDLFVGESDFITSVTAHYSDGSDNLPDNWTYDSDPTGIVDVDVITGEVIAEAEGETIITVSYTEGDITETDTIEVTVSAVVVELDHIVVLPETMDLFVGESDFITSVTAYYNDGTDNLPDNWTYGLNPIGIVTVDTSDGEVTAIAEGETTITVSYEEDDITKTDTIEVTVKVPIVIDGILSSGEWDNYYWFTDDSAGPGTGYSDAPLPVFSGYITNDDEYLYVAMEIQDTPPKSSRGAHLYIDMPPIGEFNDPDVQHFVIQPGLTGYSYGESTGGSYPNDRKFVVGIIPEGVVIVSNYNEAGDIAVVEFKIPLSVVEANPGDVIGLQFQATDLIDGWNYNFYPDVPGDITPVFTSLRVEVDDLYASLNLIP